MCYDNIIAKLAYICQTQHQGNCNLIHSKHAACLVKGHNIISTSHNNERNRIQGKICHSGHAEQVAILTYYGGSIKWRRGWTKVPHRNNDKCEKDLKRYKMFVIRLDKNGRLTESRPCQECVNLMRFVGLIKVCYSDDRGEMITSKLNCDESCTTYYTKADKRMLKIVC